MQLRDALKHRHLKNCKIIRMFDNNVNTQKVAPISRCPFCGDFVYPNVHDERADYMFYDGWGSLHTLYGLTVMCEKCDTKWGYTGMHSILETVIKKHKPLLFYNRKINSYYLPFVTKGKDLF